MSGPLYFTDDYIRKLLARESIVLSEEESRVYIPRLTALIEEKIGGVLMERLTDEQLSEFEKLFSDASTTGEQWKIFWNSHIPNFSDFVDQELRATVSEFRELLKKHT